MPTRCPACQFDNPPGLRFCGNCGRPLEAAAAPAEERRLVTVLFADVTGSTALGEQLDPEDLRALLARYYSIASDVVAAHGGTVAKFIGDAVMAVFGLPQAHGDDPERALSAALELCERVRADERLGERLPIRLGVNTGEVVATRDPGAGDFLITGDAVNVAARLEQAADSWMVLASERTAHAAADAFHFGSRLEIQAKGKQLPVPARVVLARTDGRIRRRIPLVGRDADLSHLELVARRAFGERRPFLVSLIAPAGTGKTRLLEEFLSRLPTVTPQSQVAVAQCLPYGQQLTYWPLRAVLLRFLGMTNGHRDERERPSDIRDSLREWLERGGIGDSGRMADLLAATVGWAEAEVVDRSALFTAWRSAVEAAARQEPLVLVFEDLHWSSESLLDLVEFVMQPWTDAPVLMIALARPELLDRRPGWGGGRRNYVSLTLDPLSAGAVAELVRHLLGSAPDALLDLVIARAEGNPFYAGEIVRSIAERVTSVSDTRQVEQALQTLPDTVQATVLARLDLLGRDERRVLQVGSVFGRAFSVAGVAVLAPDLAPTVSDAAARLVDKELVRPAGGDELAFRHIIIREVAYQTLPRVERARLHARAAGWLEAGAEGREESLAELIAYHYRQAAILPGEATSGAGGDDVRRNAVRWLSRAGEVATASAALTEARRHLTAAIELADRDDLPEFYERLGMASGGDAAVAAYRTALGLAREAGRAPDTELRILGRMLVLYTRFQGSVGRRPSEEELMRLFDEGEALLPRVSDEWAIATFLIAYGFLGFWHGAKGEGSKPLRDSQTVEGHALRALDIAERLEDPNLRSAALDAVGSLAQDRGDWRKCREVARRRLAFQDRLHMLERLDAYSMVAWSSALLGDLAEADRVSAEGLAILQPGQATPWALHLTSWRLYTLGLLGRWDETLATAERAHQLWIETELTTTSYALSGFVTAFDVARARRDARLVQQYREILDVIVGSFIDNHPVKRIAAYMALDVDTLYERMLAPAVFQKIKQRVYQERALALCCDLARPVASDAATAIIEFAVGHEYLMLEGQARRALGLAQEDPDELARARERFASAGAVPYVARLDCERGRVSGDQAALARGMRQLEELGDVDYLARLESTTGSSMPKSR